ncbi:Non-motile and phage-resistance protein [Magnetospirillum gryphiswaldense MSR-1]|nr:Non-motile and phage-resistance protein [Magnetospirillum gryphiswaldense MSR-1]AVM78401.1 Non-motile and phage-resistance protein [Magnetospirillum gryphiswaldense]
MSDNLPSQSVATVRALSGRATALALGLAVLLALALATLLASVSTLDEEAEVLELVGGQRMMAQRAALLAEKLERPGETALSRQRYRNELEHVAERLRDEARKVIEHPDVPPEVVILYATAWDAEAGVMARFHSAVQAVLTGRGGVDALNHREAMLFNEEVASRYRQHVADEVRQLKLVLGVSFTSLLGGLLLLFVLVLRPAIAMVRQQISRQSALGEAIVQSGHGVLLLDDQGTVGFANTYAESLTEYGEGGLDGLDLGRLLFSAYGDDTADIILETAARTTWRGDVRIVRRTGVMIWTEMVVTAAASEGGYLVIFFDATARREAEAKLRQARERLAAAIEAVDDGFALYDAEERLVQCNRKYIALLPQLEPWLVPGTSFASLIVHSWKLGLVDSELAAEQYTNLRLAQFRAGQGQCELRLRDGRILRATDRRTPEGGRVSVLADVTTLNASRDHLRRALEQAEAANRSKNVFLSSMSHELRTPLNAIVGFAQLLEGTPDGAFGPSQRRSVGHILRAGKLLDELVHQVLELADLESGNVHLYLTDFDLAAVALDACSRLKNRLQEGQLELRQTGCDSPVGAHGDAQRMAEVIGHLLSNAIKYNRPGGSIDLSVDNMVGKVRLTVRDSGNGIPPDLHDQVFQPFNRLGGEGAAVEGTGIGLAICRALIQQMGGAIGFSSTLGQGSTFWVELAAAQVKMDPSLVIGRILYVHSSPSHQALMTQLSAAHPGLTVQIVTSPEQAGRLALADPGFGLIVVDVAAAIGEAAELCQILRGNPATRFIPVIAFSDEDREGEANRLTALGFDATLGARADMAEISALVRRYCRAD